MTPALEVAKRNPRNKVAVVSEEPCDQVLAGNPNVDEVFVTSRIQRLASRLRAIRRVREFKADIAIDMHGGTTSSIMVGLSGAEMRVGPERCLNGWLFNCHVPTPASVWRRSGLHTVEDQLTSLKFLGFPVEPIPPLWAPQKPEDIQFACDVFAKAQIKRDFVLVHPGAAFTTKQWPVERFAVLAGRLIADGLQVVATVGPGEEEKLNQLTQLTDRNLKTVAPSTLGRFSAFVSFCKVYVGNDTGSTHIATALRKPVVAVFGSSDSRVWYPWQTESRVIKSDLGCIPCPGYRCLEYSEPRCIRTIEVEEVYQAVQELIA